MSKAASEMYLSVEPLGKASSKSKQKIKKLDKENVIPNLSKDKVKKMRKNNGPVDSDILRSMLAPNHKEVKKVTKKKKDRGAFHT